MRLVYKQLWKQIVKDKIFLSLLMLLTILTSLSFFFAIFSIDGNMQALNTVNKLTENQLLYQNALNSNSVLAYSFLLTLIGLSALVFIMFFYRFFRTNKKQIGCIKALGYRQLLARLFRWIYSYFIYLWSILRAAWRIFFIGYFNKR